MQRVIGLHIGQSELSFLVRTCSKAFVHGVDLGALDRLSGNIGNNAVKRNIFRLLRPGLRDTELRKEECEQEEKNTSHSISFYECR